MATRNALAQLAFTAEEVRLTAEVAAAVLHLGQLEFRRLRGSIVEEPQSVDVPGGGKVLLSELAVGDVYGGRAHVCRRRGPLFVCGVLLQRRRNRSSEGGVLCRAGLLALGALTLRCL